MPCEIGGSRQVQALHGLLKESRSDIDIGLMRRRHRNAIAWTKAKRAFAGSASIAAPQSRPCLRSKPDHSIGAGQSGLGGRQSRFPIQSLGTGRPGTALCEAMQTQGRSLHGPVPLPACAAKTALRPATFARSCAVKPLRSTFSDNSRPHRRRRLPDPKSLGGGKRVAGEGLIPAPGAKSPYNSGLAPAPLQETRSPASPSCSSVGPR